MSSSGKKSANDPLGLQSPIDRRDLLNSTLLAAGSVLLGGLTPLQMLSQEDWTGYGGIGDYATANGNTYEVMTAGHQIRDHRLNSQTTQPIDTGELFDCVVVGGGISGLAAALFYARETQGKRSCLVLDNHPVFGGEAKRNEFEVDGERLIAHQGSAACFPPLPGSFLSGFYDSVGLRWDEFRYQEWAGPQPALRVETAPYPTGGSSSGFFFGPAFNHPKGLWIKDPWGTKLAEAPIPDQVKRELLGMREADQRPFVQHRFQPKIHGDEASRHLDSITLEEHLKTEYQLSTETVRRFISPVSGGGSGLGADALSAYCEYAADVLLPWQYDKGAQMFPGGNAGVARQIVRALIPAALPAGDMGTVCRAQINFAALDRKDQSSRIRSDSTVVSVKHEGDSSKSEALEICYTRGGKLYRVRARSAVIAGGSWTAKHILLDLPATQREAYARFHRAPCLMANVALRNWRFLYNFGLTEARWFEGFGNYAVLRKVATFGTEPGRLDPDRPTVLNLKILFSRPGLPLQEQVVRGRGELFSTPYREYERRIREQLTMLFGQHGFDAKRDIAGIILNRWGHAYLSPQPGFFFGSADGPAPGEVLREKPYGRIAFANSDLSGIMDHRMSISEAKRAVDQIKSASIA
jgi:spermidine dehydrogenase